jgi:hypothetical protein
MLNGFSFSDGWRVTNDKNFADACFFLFTGLTLPVNRFSLSMFGEPNRHQGDAESLTRERQ